MTVGPASARRRGHLSWALLEYPLDSISSAEWDGLADGTESFASS